MYKRENGLGSSYPNLAQPHNVCSLFIKECEEVRRYVMEKYTKLTHEDFIQIMNQVDNSLEIQRRIYKHW